MVFHWYCKIFPNLLYCPRSRCEITFPYCSVNVFLVSLLYTSVFFFFCLFFPTSKWTSSSPCKNNFPSFTVLLKLSYSLIIAQMLFSFLHIKVFLNQVCFLVNSLLFFGVFKIFSQCP